MTIIVRYVCRFGQPVLTQARPVPSSYTVIVQGHVTCVREIVNVVKPVSEAHRCASAKVNALTVMRQ